jgi:hypothetical protein
MREQKALVMQTNPNGAAHVQRLPQPLPLAEEVARPKRALQTQQQQLLLLQMGYWG